MFLRSAYASGDLLDQLLQVGLLHVFATVQGSNSIYTFVGAAPSGGFTTSGTGVTSAAVSGTPAGLAVH
jgi:hypothetical protein